FQAEDGIRDRNVTGVQTCALPILRIEDLAHALQVAVRQRDDPALADHRLDDERGHVVRGLVADRVLDSVGACQCARSTAHAAPRSEERREGKEWGGRGGASDAWTE